MNTTYDVVRCSDNQWGNEVMRKLADHHFAEHPACMFVEVTEHGGWRLGFRRDGTCWSTANDAAVLSHPTPQPTGYSCLPFFHYPDVK